MKTSADVATAVSYTISDATGVRLCTTTSISASPGQQTAATLATDSCSQTHSPYLGSSPSLDSNAAWAAFIAAAHKQSRKSYLRDHTLKNVHCGYTTVQQARCKSLRTAQQLQQHTAKSSLRKACRTSASLRDLSSAAHLRRRCCCCCSCAACAIGSVMQIRASSNLQHLKR